MRLVKGFGLWVLMLIVTGCVTTNHTGWPSEITESLRMSCHHFASEDQKPSDGVTRLAVVFENTKSTPLELNITSLGIDAGSLQSLARDEEKRTSTFWHCIPPSAGVLWAIPVLVGSVAIGKAVSEDFCPDRSYVLKKEPLKKSRFNIEGNTLLEYPIYIVEPEPTDIDLRICGAFDGRDKCLDIHTHTKEKGGMRSVAHPRCEVAVED